jgi:hypothetical protein
MSVGTISNHQDRTPRKNADKNPECGEVDVRPQTSHRPSGFHDTSGAARKRDRDGGAESDVQTESCDRGDAKKVKREDNGHTPLPDPRQLNRVISPFPSTLWWWRQCRAPRMIMILRHGNVKYLGIRHLRIYPQQERSPEQSCIIAALRGCSQLLCCAKEGFNTFLQYHVLFAAFVEGERVCMPKVLFWWVVLLRATLERISTCHRDGQPGFAPGCVFHAYSWIVTYVP